MSNETAVAAPATSAVATPHKTFRDLIQSDGYKKQLAAAMPKGLTVDRMVRVVLTAINKTPKLLDCTETSLWASVLNCASLGLFPDPLGRAYLVPYGKECQLIVGYKGLIDLAYRSDRIASINLVVVREGDVFERQPMESPPIKHKIVEPSDGSFRKMTHVYSVVYLKGCDIPSTDVMTIQEVRDIQKRSKSGTSGPWVTDFEEMAKKTVFRRHSKVLPMSAEMSQALELDGDQLDLSSLGGVPRDRMHDNFGGVQPKTQDVEAEVVPQGQNGGAK